MQPISGPGLVLRRHRHLEEDARLIVFMRDHGKFLVVSRGGLKFTARLKALQEPFTECDFQLSTSAHGLHARLVGGKLIRSAHGLAASIEAFGAASLCAEVVDAALPYRAPSPEVFDILRTSFQTLSLGENPVHQWLTFCWSMLRSLGYGDLTAELSRLLPESEKAGEGGLSWPRYSPSSLNRCRAFLESRLEAILPGPLKSGVLLNQ